jgi:hypothetical protein
MNAAPLLQEITRAMQECGLEAVLVGNAAAALQGAPVTTIDFDFMFRETPANLKRSRLPDKLTAASSALLSRVSLPPRKEDSIRLDFMSSGMEFALTKGCGQGVMTFALALYVAALRT